MKKSFVIHKQCSSCGSRNKSIIFRFKNTDLVKCSNCGLYYLTKQRSDLTNLYTNSYYKYGKETTGANYCNYDIQEKLVNKNFTFAYKFIERVKKPNVDVLEIGAGYGYFPKYLKKNVRYHAIEISPETVKIISKKYKASVGDFMDIKLHRRYDAIVAFDVIEHQLFLGNFLRKVNKSLDQRGLFIFTTPDFGSVINKFFRKNAPTIQLDYHNYYLDQKWIIKNAPLFGFRVVYIKTVYFAHLSIGQILLLATFAVPLLKRIHVSLVAKRLRLENLIIPFVRLGGIECVLQKK